jgi:hypothetical protein
MTDNDDGIDMVRHPPHYTRGPLVTFTVPNPDYNGMKMPDMTITRMVECIEIIRHITDGRLFSAMKYIWRVAFGGKDNDREDIEKAIWYLQDWLAYPAGKIPTCCEDMSLPEWTSHLKERVD